jgi:predicted nucleotide-binding protein (sugar kinase/HSP70/actin superfamily)
MLMRILKKIGYDGLDFVVVDLSPEIKLKEFTHRIGKISDASPLSAAGKIKALSEAVKVMHLCDELDARAHYLAGFEKKSGECRRILGECKTAIIKSESPGESLKLLRSYIKQLDGVETDSEKDPLVISIIGEIYTIIEPFSNFQVEEKLMDYGVSTKRMLTPSWWMRNVVMKPVGLDSRDVYKAAKEYLPYSVGGHGRECIGEAVLAKDHGSDGAIQILPLGCMPEVVAKAILPAIQRDKDFPIMTLIVDEVTGEAGYITRLEAFLDILESRKRKKIRGLHPLGKSYYLELTSVPSAPISS